MFSTSRVKYYCIGKILSFLSRGASKAAQVKPASIEFEFSKRIAVISADGNSIMSCSGAILALEYFMNIS